MDIAFISCSKRKRAGRHPAYLLYDSELFKRAYWYAEKRHPHVYILSAKHGVVDILRVTEEYDLTLTTMSREAQRRCARRTAEVINRMVPREWNITFYCGKVYTRDLIPLLHHTTCETPLAHMGIGEQLRWYAQRGYCSKAAR